MIELFIHQPTEWINANHRIHWAVRSKRTKAWREAAKHAAKDTGSFERVHVTIHVHKKTRRQYDSHNLMPTAKACIDGLVDAGIIPDDTNAHLIGPDMRQGEVRPIEPGLTLIITPLNPHAPF